MSRRALARRAAAAKPKPATTSPTAYSAGSSPSWKPLSPNSALTPCGWPESSSPVTARRRGGWRQADGGVQAWNRAVQIAAGPRGGCRWVCASQTALTVLVAPVNNLSFQQSLSVSRCPKS